MPCDTPVDRRALSPVVGGALLIAIVVLLVSVTAVMLFGAAETDPAAPQADLALEPVEGSDEYRLRLQAGDTLDGDRIRIRGIKDPDTLAGKKLVAGEPIRVEPVDDTVRIVWLEDAAEGTSYTLQTFVVDSSSGSGGARGGAVTFPDGVVFTGSSGDIIQIAGNGGEVTTILSRSTVEGVGSPEADVTGDGSPDLPFVTSGETIKVIDPDGDVTTVADSSDIPGSIATSKTKLAVGSWDGSPTSVFFVNQNNDKIYRSTPSGSTQVAVDLSGGSENGAQAIAGFADIDDDGTDELVYADASQTLRYLEPSGSVIDTGLSLGSSNGIGTGSTGTLDGYPGEVVTGVSGGNYIYVVSDAGNDRITSGDVSGASAPQAKKSPTTVADVDGDGATELVYVGNDDGKLKYLDTFGGTIEIKYLQDDAGTKIDGSAETGVS